MIDGWRSAVLGSRAKTSERLNYRNGNIGHPARGSLVTLSDPTPGPIRVLMVLDTFSFGGAENLMAELGRYDPVTLEVSVASLAPAGIGKDAFRDRLVDAGLHPTYASVRRLLDPVGFLRLVRLLRRAPVDVVHAHLSSAAILVPLAARLVGKPVVATLHLSPQRQASFREWVKERLSVRIPARLGVVVFVSKHAYDQYASHHGPARPSWRMIPNGVDLNRYAARGAPRSVERPLWAVVAALRPDKNHLGLIRAWAGVVDRYPGATLLVIGEGPARGEIECAIADAELTGSVKLLGRREDVPDILPTVDGVVSASVDEALPTALIEAGACGLPVVAADAGGTREIVIDRVTGRLVPVRDVPALTEALVDTIGNPARAAEYGRAGRALAEKKYSMPIWVSQLEALYTEVMGDRSLAGVGRPRRIALVEFAPSGGLFQFALQLGEALAREGEEVELITGPSPELASREPGCRVRSILPTWHPAAGADAPEWWRRARRGIRAGRHTAAWAVLMAYLLRTRPDVIIWSIWRFPIDGWGVHLVRRVLPNAVLALVAHEPRPLVEQPGQQGMYKSSRAMKGALAQAYRDLDAAFVLGESAKQALIDSWPIAASVHVIPHGDERILAPEAVPAVDTTGPVALSFGTITAYKGIDTLLEAWPKVRARVPDAELVIAGALSADVDEAALRSQVAGLPGVSLRLGYVPVAGVAPYFAEARCVVLPYKRSSQSGVAHLAHTMARPVVATRVGDIPAVVRDEVSGLLVEPDDPEALAAALVRLLTDPVLARRLGAAGAEALAAGASWDEVAGRLRRGLPGPATGEAK